MFKAKQEISSRTYYYGEFVVWNE